MTSNYGNVLELVYFRPSAWTATELVCRISTVRDWPKNLEPLNITLTAFDVEKSWVMGSRSIEIIPIYFVELIKFELAIFLWFI